MTKIYSLKNKLLEKKSDWIGWDYNCIELDWIELDLN